MTRSRLSGRRGFPAGRWHQHRHHRPPLTRLPHVRVRLAASTLIGLVALGGPVLLANPAAAASAASAMPSTGLAAGPIHVTSTPPPVGQQADPAAAADAAAGWLAGQLVEGTHLTSSGYVDYGLTADAILAFAAAGVAGQAGEAATSYLVDNLESYVGDGTQESYAGALAKAALVLITQGLDPRNAGGVDLIDRLSALEADADAPLPGRFSDHSQYGDYSNTIGQSFALLTLTRADDIDPSPAAVDALLAQQCDDGGLRLNFPSADDATACTSDPDATAIAVPALLVVGEQQAAEDAVDYLEGRQQADGGIANVGPGAVANTNTTGLAAAAFTQAGRTQAASDAVQFLLSAQQDCAAPADQIGALAYTPGQFAVDTAVRATAQGVLGLAGVTYTQVSAVGAQPDVPEVVCPTAPADSTADGQDDAATGGTQDEQDGTSETAGSQQAVAGQEATLPATGPDDQVLTVAVGLALTVAGALLVWATRRRGSA